MLTRNALEAALPLTQQLDARSLYLQAIPATPLGELVKATRADEKFNVPLDGGGWSPDLANIEYVANAQAQDGVLNAHDCAMDSIVTVAINTVQKAILMAKTVVAPVVEDLVERVRQGLATMTPSAMLGLEVCVVELPAVLDNPALMAALQRYQDAPLDNPRMNLRMPELGVNELREMAAAGLGTGGKDVASWLASKGDAWVASVWHTFFQVKPGDSAPTFQGLLRAEDGVEVALLVFLLARRLIDAVPPGVEMNLRALQETLVDYRNQAAARVSRACAEQELAVKVGTLVRKQDARRIWVNGGVYTAWLKSGGSNEILFGNMLSAQPGYSAADLKARSKELKAAWDRHAAVTNSVEAGRRFLRTKELLAACFEEQVQAVGEGDPTLSGSRMEVLRLFHDMLNNVREVDLNDFYGTALKLVCRSRFVNTDSEMILTGIERAKQDNPQLDVREAAAISVIQYVSWWVSTQFKVVAL